MFNKVYCVFRKESFRYGARASLVGVYSDKQEAERRAEDIDKGEDYSLVVPMEVDNDYDEVEIMEYEE